MELKEFSLAHQKFCSKRITGKKCDAKRDLKSDRCAHCVVDYLNAQAALETFDTKAEVSNVAPKFATVSDEAVRRGLNTIINHIRSGNGRKTLPIGARPVISGTVFEVVDHDTVKVEGLEHTMTLRIIMTDYHEMPFNASEGTINWSDSHVRSWLNGTFFGKLSAPLREVIVAPKLLTYVPGKEEVEFEFTTDKVWLPSSSQMGVDDDMVSIMEGEVLDAFDDELSIDHVARRTIAEYHGDEIVPKGYWLRSNDGKMVHAISKIGKLDKLEPRETTAMVVPFITIG